MEGEFAGRTDRLARLGPKRKSEAGPSVRDCDEDLRRSREAVKRSRETLRRLEDLLRPKRES